MIPVVRLRTAAERDLEAIWAYTVEQWNEAQAERYIGGLRSMLEKIVAFPSLGKPYHPIAKVRVAAYRRHRIVYRPIPDGIEVLRLIHEARDLDLVLASDEALARQDEGSGREAQ